MSHNLFNVNFPDVVFKLWKEEGGKSIATPPSFAMNILERLGHLDHWTDSPSLLHEATTSIAELDAYQNSLKSHLNSIQETVDALRDAVLPYMFGKGIDTIPDEILSTIFESFGTESYDTVIQTCSLVSRRFRWVVLNTPRLWCTVSIGTASMDCVIRSLERSKSLGLNVQLALDEQDDFHGLEKPKLDCSDVFDAVLAHSERWESFQCDLDSNTQAASAGRQPDILELLKKLTYLPCLTDMTMHRGYEDDKKVEDLIFLESLCAPQLHRLCASQCLPGPSAFSSTLTSLDFTFWDIQDEPQLLHRLYTFLVSIPTLAEVSLNLDCDYPLSASDGEFPPFVLQKLKTLDFTIQGALCNRVLSFREALITPAIVDCSFTAVDLDWDEDTTSAVWSVGSDGELLLHFLEFMLCHDEYPTLEALSIVLMHGMNGPVVRFKIPFDKVPNLRKLTLDIHRFDPLAISARRIPALRSLTVRHLGSDAWFWVQRVLLMLREQGDLGGLEKVDIGKIYDDYNGEWVETHLYDDILRCLGTTT